MHKLKAGLGSILCLSLLVLIGFGQSGQEPATPQNSEANQEDAPAGAPSENIIEQEAELAGRTIRFGPVEPLRAYLNTNTIALRETPDENAPIVARLEGGEFEAAEVLETKGDFVRIRLSKNDDAQADVPHRDRAYEAWTTWDAIVPDMTALVLDAETGAVVARVPLTDGLSSVIFSPDGSKAMFFNGGGGIGSVAYEVRTSDYKFTRALSSTEGAQFGTLFYGPADESLYARVYGTNSTLMRIGGDGLENTPIAIPADMIVSPDGRIGFFAHEQEGGELPVDVIDLATLQLRNSFTLSGENVPSGINSFVLNKDGSELYVKLGQDSGPISVIDTWTGQPLRVLANPAKSDWSYFSQGDLVGNSLIVRTGDEGNDEMPVKPRNYWVSDGRIKRADPAIEFAVEAGDKRFAVNGEGTRLFRLDSNNRIQERFKIHRPERGTDRETGNALTVFGLSSSPDGKQIIMFVGIEHGC